MQNTNYKEIVQCGSLKVDCISNEVRDWYNDLQIDFEKFFNIMYEWLPIGYGINDTYYTPEENRKKLESNYSPSMLKNIDIYIKLILKLDGVDKQANTSNYSLFYKDYKSSGKANFSERWQNIFKDLRVDKFDEKLNLTLKEQIKISKDLKKLCKNQPVENIKNIFKDYWNSSDLPERFANKDREVGSLLLKGLKISCKRPANASYCKTLYEMLRRELLGAYEKHELHVKEYNELKEKVESFNDDLLYLMIIEFGKELESKNSGLTKYVLNRAIKEYSKPKEESNIQLILDTIAQPKYKKLLDSAYPERMRSFNKYKLYKKLNRRKKYPFKPTHKNNMQVPFGTGYKTFSLSLDGKKPLISFKDFGNITCKPSNYFKELKLKNLDNGYELTFKSSIATIEGTLKEINLQIKNNSFFVFLPFTIKHSKTNFEIGNYFCKASPSKKDLKKLPNEIIVGAIDIGITNPICTTVAKIEKNGNGPIKAGAYGRGSVIKCDNLTPPSKINSSYLYVFSKQVAFLKDAIREWKECKHNNLTINEEIIQKLMKVKGLSEKTKEWLTTADQFASVRIYIQSHIKILNERVKKLNQRVWENKNVASMIRILQINDLFNSLISSYKRIHLKPNESLPEEKKFDKSRANFRDNLMKQIAFKVSKWAVENKINCVFGEDLTMQQDGDKSARENTLTRLFSGRVLISYIQNALEKNGICFIPVVDPSGTSKTDFLTGDLGFRLGNKLYVKRNNKIVSLHADVAASLNILIKGLNASVVPYKFRVFEGTANKDGKRIQAFMKSKFGGKVNFHMKNGEINPLRKKSKMELYSGTLYFRNGKFITETEHRNAEEEWKNVEKSSKIKDVAVVDKKHKNYKNFSL